jgi:hypothetical protein
MSYDRALRLAIHNFHKVDEASAIQYLEDLISRQQQKKKFLKRQRVDAIRKDLRSYIKWWKTCDDTVIDSDFLLKDAGGGFLVLSGKVSRLDLTDKGYRAVLFGVPKPGWKQELRMPLIQAAVSGMYNRPLNEIAVGFQKPNGMDLQTTIYSAEEVKRARDLFKALATQLGKQ